MTKKEAWKALSAEFEAAKAEYYSAKEKLTAYSDTSEYARFAYIEGRFNGLYAAREILAPYFLPQ